MTLGLSLGAFTTLHVIISLVAIVAGLVAAFGMLGNHRLPRWTFVFLITTVLTSVTGFMFPFKAIGPPHIVGAISLVLLVPCLLGIYAFHHRGAWRWIYVVTALLSLYLNVFVLVVQAFQKVGPLHVFAPQGSEPPFAIAQGVVFVLFVWLTVLAVRRFRPVPPLTMRASR